MRIDEMVQERLATSDGWIPHNGGPCPIPDAKANQYEIKYSDETTFIPYSLDARHCDWVSELRDDGYTITHYRLIKPTPSDTELLRQAGEALRLADQHIQHMGEWIAARKAGYSFESLGEDRPTISAVLAAIDARMK